MTRHIPSVRGRYERIAPFYDFLDGAFERGRYCQIRPLLFESLSGRILDAGVGTGRNMPWYPTNSDVVGVDLSPSMLKRARRRQATSEARVTLMEADISRLAFPDAAFDAAVASFVFCTLPDTQQLPTLRELARVVKPDAPIRLLEYTQPRGGLRRLSAALWAPWVHWAYGASFDRHPEQYFAAAGLVHVASRFVVDDLICLIEVTPRK